MTNNELIPGKLYEIQQRKVFYDDIEALDSISHKRSITIANKTILMFIERSEGRCYHWFLTPNGQKMVTWHIGQIGDTSWFREIDKTPSP